jgi:TonB-linked SusC/RagA family outer membrane protein
MNLHRLKACVLVVLIQLIATGAFCQATMNPNTFMLNGRVTDPKGSELEGVSVHLLGGQQGTITDGSGSFSIRVNNGDTLGFSFLGYLTKKVVIGARSPLLVVLHPGNSRLDEVVVVGYGTETRRNVISSVGQIPGSEIQNRPNSNVVQSLEGKMPGVDIVMVDGKPNRNPVPKIRGVVNSIGSGGQALVLIDGVEGDLSTVNPDDVKSISVLKDATAAAIYGARGAFGVILVTTKSGASGKVKVHVNSSIATNVRTTKLEDDIVSNGLKWTNSFLQAYEGAFDYTVKPSGINNAFPFSEEWYEELQKHDADPTLPKVELGDNGQWQYYGNTNWPAIFYRKHNLSHQYSVDVSGGGDVSRFYISARQFEQDGIYNAGGERFKGTNLSAKGEINIRPGVRLSNNTRVYVQDYHQPMLFYGRELLQRQWDQEGYPVTVPMNPDGTWSEAGVYVGWRGFKEGSSYQNTGEFDLTNTTALEVTPVKDVLNFKADFTYHYGHSSRFRVENMYQFNKGPAVTGERQTYSDIENWGYNNKYMSGNLTGHFTPRLGPDHSFSLMAGWNIEDKTYDAIKTYRQGILYPSQPTFAMMDGEYYAADQDGYSWGIVGGFFRAKYGYRDKYLAEVSGRYDGTSKFPTDQQWGFFPSVSLGWVVSRENFMKGTESWLDNFKIRASVGSLGNGQVDPYSYLSTMDIAKTSVLIDGTQQSYTGAPGLIPSGLTWEKVTTYDIGTDIDMLKGRLNVVFDYYQRYTNDMYTVGPTLPQVLGDAAPRGNNADLRTSGWEFSASWNNSFKVAGKDFHYNVKAMLWDSRSFVTKYYNANGNITTYAAAVTTHYYKGMQIGEIWGFTSDGLFKDEQDVASHADQSFFNNSSNRVPLPGDLKFRDINGDGKVDRGNQTLSDHGDLKIIGNASPRYQFGVNLGFSWDNIDIGAFFQGVGKEDWYPSAESGLFWGQYNRPYGLLPKVMTGNNVWTEENQNINAYWPRQRGYLANRNEGPMTLPNTRYLQNVAYVRVKNLTVGYTLPASLSHRLYMENVRVYFSGDNIFTYSPLSRHTKIFDPEVIHNGDPDYAHTAGSGETADGYSYPMLKKFAFGIDFTL